jgi:hypothetical protein
LGVRLALVGLGSSTYFADRVGGVAAIHPLQVDGPGPDLPADDLALPAAIEASSDGLLQGKDQSDLHLCRVDVAYMKASRGLTT